jgi:hypothetical protein
MTNLSIFEQEKAKIAFGSLMKKYDSCSTCTQPKQNVVLVNKDLGKLLPHLAQAHVRHHNPIDEELKMYCSSVHLISVAEDPLEWWKKNQFLYPRIAAVARQVLAIPATNAHSERLWSYAGKLVTVNRFSLSLSLSLSSETICKTLFIHANTSVIQQ